MNNQQPQMSNHSDGPFPNKSTSTQKRSLSISQVVRKKRFVTPFKSNKTNTATNSETDQSTSRPSSSCSAPIQLASNCSSLFVKSKFKPPASTLSAPLPVCSEKTQLAVAKEKLRRLQLVGYHHKHNDLQTLVRLTAVWKETGHDALHKLHAEISAECKPSRAELLQHLHIPQEHITCDCDDA